MAERAVKKPIEKGVAKVPVVMQLEALECGAACLCMVMAYYEKWIPLEQVRSDCGVSRDGSNARNILRAARSYGMEAKGYRLEPEDLRKNGSFPCILHWEFNHFVVCNGFKNGKVYLNDPARGNVAVSMERFDESFTGVVLMLEPTEDFVPEGKPKSVLGFARERLKGASAAMTFVVLTTIITSLGGIVGAGFSRVFLDYLLPGNNPQWIVPFFAGLLLLSLIQIVAGWIQAVYSLRINGKMAAVGNASYMWKILRLPMEFFSQRMAGDIQTRKQSNADIAAQVVNTLAPLVLSSAMLVFYLVVMIRYSLMLTLIGLGSLVINIVLSRIISKKRVNITRVAMRDQGKLAGATMGALDMIETIKASGAENGCFERWAGYQASVNTQNIRLLRLNQYLGMLPGMVGSILNILILVLGVYLTMNGEFTVGMILAFQGFLTSFMTPANQLISAGQVIQEMRTSMERIEDVMKYPIAPVFSGEEESSETEEAESEENTGEGKATSYNKLRGNLVMKNVTFGYSRLAPPLIENFELALQQGQRVAFVGFSGCG